MTESENTLNYYAYGSNINLPNLRWYLSLHQIDHHDHVKQIRYAVLPDHRLRTNYITWEGSGACNIQPCKRRTIGLGVDVFLW